MNAGYYQLTSSNYMMINRGILWIPTADRIYDFDGNDFIDYDSSLCKEI